MLIAQYETRGPVPQDLIKPVEIAEPELTEGQVLVKVLASPINPSDVLTLTGEYGILPPLPAIGGNEGVGVVEKHGPGVTNPPVGQNVMLPIGGGTWSTHMVCNAKELIPLPNEVDPKQLCMMCINPPTAMLMLDQFVELQEGDWVIQNAANSGVGSYLIQLAKLRGFRTINVVRRESAGEVVKANGGDEVLVDGDDLHKQVKEIVGDRGVKLAIDAVAGAATDRLALSLSRGGTLVSYGAMSMEPCQINAFNLVFRDITLKGFWLAKWFKEATPKEQQALYGQIVQYIAQGKLHTKIHAEYTVDQIQEAITEAATGNRDGKILIVT
jgi:NADPH:quinone reductase-like Zn-dependent oxidoreductase